MKRLFLLCVLLALSVGIHAQSIPCTSSATPVKSGLTVTNWTDATVADANQYFYVVVAVDSSTGLYSTCTPILGPEAIPSTGVHTVSLNWIASTSSGVTYSVFRAVSPQPATGLTGTVN